MSVLSALGRAFTGPGAVARVAGAGVLIGTLAAQHPHPAFNRIQRLDRLGSILPNWRFFAPHPAQHDFVLFYRTLDAAGETSDWRPLEVIAGRRARQAAWFPERRTEKAVFDICNELQAHLKKGFQTVTRLPSYRLLSAYLRRTIRESGAAEVKGFQFTLARTTGYDETTEPEIVFVSPYTPMAAEHTPQATPATAPARADQPAEAS
ncbi:hypothetical protein [Streptomyces sp. AJS327]|uniref:hypothetical protein n=1 Tax=Streptomyces sp. AJS327 TaxID=2545265 RepID=UPI0015DE8F65|nr:hypothetical protein [Streptomyces sp. AJS327]